MTTAEDIEKAVARLSPSELARFRAWYEVFDAQQFDAAIARTQTPASLMRLRTKPLPRTTPDARARCDAFRVTKILDRVRGIAAPGPKAGRRELRTA